jgi:hypothetical protein
MLSLISIGSPINRLANQQVNEFEVRVAAQSGYLVGSELPVELYRQFYTMNKFPLHGYSSGGAYTVRNSGGTNFVPAWVDLVNTNPVNFVQATNASQPSVSADGDVSAFPVLKFDRTDDFMSNADLSMFNGKSAGTVIAVVKDDAPSSGTDATHLVFLASMGTTPTGSRLALLTRNTSNTFTAVGRRTDAQAVASASNASNSTGFHFLVNSSNWAGNSLQLRVDSTNATADTFTVGAGVQSGTDSQAVRIGASTSSTSRFGGSYGELLIFDQALTADELTAIQNIYKRYYTTLP